MNQNQCKALSIDRADEAHGSAHKTQEITCRRVACALLFSLALLLLQPRLTAMASDKRTAPVLTPLGVYSTGLFNLDAARGVAVDAATQRAFVVNAAAATIDIVDLTDPAHPALVGTIDVTPLGEQPNAVTVYAGLIAVAVEAKDKQANGVVAFFTPEGDLLGSVDVGAQPSRLVFTPDGSRLLVANQGEPNQKYSDDPEGSISVIDLSRNGAAVTAADVATADFSAFKKRDLDPRIRIFGPDASAAQDLEPTAIAVSPDSTTAWVTLQENNALAVVDIARATVTALLPLGVKDFSRPLAFVQPIEVVDPPVVGASPAGQPIRLGGFSGLFFEGVDVRTGNLRFVANTDRGPNAGPVELDPARSDGRPYVIPGFGPRIVRFEVNPATSALTITQQITLTLRSGASMTGLPNIAGAPGLAYSDETPIDLFGKPLPLDRNGIDPEAIVRTPDGAFWISDEFRPAIDQFDRNGVLIARYVPAGVNAAAKAWLGIEALPAVYAQRRDNRGFEGLAYDRGVLYAFMQSPLDNPDVADDANAKKSRIVRILAFDTTRRRTVGQYLYVLDGGAVDKLGDAVALGSGKFLVLERDDVLGPTASKYIYQVDLTSATNVHTLPAPAVAYESMSEQELIAAGIQPVHKTLFVDLIAAGYDMAAKPEGLALVDGNTLAVINDDDFGLFGTFDPKLGALLDNPAPQASVLGLIALRSNGLDASDIDGRINIQLWPVSGLYQPSAIAAYTAMGATYLVMANEGAPRTYSGANEEVRVADLALDPAVFADAERLQRPESLGRLHVSLVGSDRDENGLADTLLTFGGRSFSIATADGRLLWDSGDDLETITADVAPQGFNVANDDAVFDGRSDDRGPEPGSLALGEIDGRVYAFVGLEQVGGIVIYDVTNPGSPEFMSYTNRRDFAAGANSDVELGPVDMQFVAAAVSPTGAPLLLVANKVSGTLTLYSVTGF